MHNLKKRQQTIIDYLVDHMDNLKPFRGNLSKNNYVNASAANCLFTIWKNQSNKVSKRMYKRPPTVSLSDVQLMQKEGLVVDIGDKLELTSKGTEVIKIMILGDERSIFDDNGYNISYNEAVAKTKERSLKTSQKHYHDLWWDKI